MMWLHQAACNHFTLYDLVLELVDSQVVKILMGISVITQCHSGIHPLLQQSDALIALACGMQPGLDHETNGGDFVFSERTQNRFGRPLRSCQDRGSSWLDEGQVVNRDGHRALGNRSLLCQDRSKHREQRDRDR